MSGRESCPAHDRSRPDHLDLRGQPGLSGVPQLDRRRDALRPDPEERDRADDLEVGLPQLAAVVDRCARCHVVHTVPGGSESTSRIQASSTSSALRWMTAFIGVIVGEFDEREISDPEEDEGDEAQPCAGDENGSDPGDEGGETEQEITGPDRPFVNEGVMKESVDGIELEFRARHRAEGSGMLVVRPIPVGPDDDPLVANRFARGKILRCR